MSGKKQQQPEPTPSQPLAQLVTDISQRTRIAENTVLKVLRAQGDIMATDFMGATTKVIVPVMFDAAHRIYKATPQQ